MELFSKIRDFNPVEEVFGDWQTLDSSNVAAYRYNKGERLMEVRFHSGRVYQFVDVPENVAEGIATADSPGKYFNASIKNSYSHR